MPHTTPTRFVRRSAFLLAVVACGGWVYTEVPSITLLRSSPRAKCEGMIPHLDWTLTLWVALAGYLVGGGMALLRTQAERDAVATSHRGGGHGWGSTKFHGYLVLWFFLANLVILLGYETYAVATGNTPITAFVRCANVSPDTRPVLALGVGAIAYLLGHWFWYPLRWWDAPPESPTFRPLPVLLIVLGVLAGLALAVYLALNTPGGFLVTLIWIILGWLALSALAELYSWWQEDPEAVARLHTWSGQYPLFAAGVALMVGLLLGHFF